MRLGHLHVGESLWRGVCALYPNALTYRTESYTFDETRGYQLCHYDIVVAQLVATCFINYANEDGIPEFILALEKAREKLARRGVPMLDATLLATAHLQVFASLHYPETTREWERLSLASQT